jgi:hypothetical protein
LHRIREGNVAFVCVSLGEFNPSKEAELVEEKTAKS